MYFAWSCKQKGYKSSLSLNYPIPFFFLPHLGKLNEFWLFQDHLLYLTLSELWFMFLNFVQTWSVVSPQSNGFWLLTHFEPRWSLLYPTILELEFIFLHFLETRHRWFNRFEILTPFEPNWSLLSIPDHLGTWASPCQMLPQSCDQP